MRINDVDGNKILRALTAYVAAKMPAAIPWWRDADTYVASAGRRVSYAGLGRYEVAYTWDREEMGLEVSNEAYNDFTGQATVARLVLTATISEGHGGPDDDLVVMWRMEANPLSSVGAQDNRAPEPPILYGKVSNEILDRALARCEIWGVTERVMGSIRPKDEDEAGAGQ